MKISTIFLILLSINLSFAQDKMVSEEVVLAIKSDVWMPFMEAYAELDAEKLKSIHTKDIIRINIDGGKVRKGEAYLEEFGGFLDQMKAQGNQIRISFSILSTAVDNEQELAHQTGHYQFSFFDPKSKEYRPSGYGYFHVGLQKESGKWKIFMDSDQKVDLSHEDFGKDGLLYRLEP